MHRILIHIGVAITLAGPTTIALADARDDVAAAAKRLSDSDNYSWTTTSEGAGGMGGSAQGKTQRDGLTMLNLSLRDGEVQAFLKGDKAAFKTPDGEWQSANDAAVADQQGPARMIANMITTYQPPAAQAQQLADQAKDLKKSDDGSFTGTLSANDAKALIQRRISRRSESTRAGSEVKNPSATVKFWLADTGMLTKFQFNVQGTMTINGEDRDINRTTTVEIKDIGATKIDVPDEAKAKMG